MVERARRRASRRRVIALGAGGALVAAGAGTAWAVTSTAGASYRLAIVERADITQTVDADGVLSVSRRSTVSFAASGRVTSVRVSVGDHVRAGQTLATLDRATMEAAVTSAKATLAQARQQLADDEQAQAADSSSSSSTATPTSAPSSAPNSSAPASAGSSDNGAAAGIRKAQQAVEAAQHALDTAIQAVSSDVEAATAACAAADTTPTSEKVTADGAGTVSGSAGDVQVVATLLDTTTTSANPQTVAAHATYTFAGLTPGATYQRVLVPQTDTAGCTAALDTLKKDQSGATNAASVVNAQHELAVAISALDAAIAHSSDGSDPASSAPRPTPSSSAANPSGSATSPTKSDRSSTSVTAEQIAADTKSVDAAQAALAVARHDLDYANLTSPISGTVGAVAISKGDLLSASSTSSTITVIGGRSMSVTLNVGIADVDRVHVGQHAQVTVDGRSAPLRATVTYVGTLNSSSSTGSSSTYPVTVTIAEPSSGLVDAMGASVAIDVGHAHNVLSVPVSAVHTVGTLHTVTLDRNGKPSVARVTLGVQGDERIQITSGVHAGQRVVLAEVSAAVPSQNSSQFGSRRPFGNLRSVFRGGGPAVFGR